MKLYFKEVSKTILDVKVDTRTECFNFGSDNAFPSLVEALIGMSVTSKTCADRAAKAIYGASFGDAGKKAVNSKGQSLNEVLRIAARQYAKHNNCYIHIAYNGLFEIKGITAVPVTDVRVGKADDKGYSGKYIVYDNWDKQKKKKIQSSEFKVCFKFNPDKSIVEKQVKASKKNKKGEGVGEIEDYQGQILHIRKDDTYIYSLPDISPVLSEALLESNSQTFRSRGAQKGFLNVKVMVVPPFKDDPARKEFMKDLNDSRGAENSSDTILLELAQPTEDASKQMNLQDLTGEYNDKLFEYSDKQAEKNICKAFTVPLMLVSQTDNSLFGSSGEMLKEAKLQLWESREEDRDQFEEAFSIMFKYFDKEKINIDGESLKVKNPYIDEDEEQQTKNLNKQSQATLRGSVGGVTAITSLIQAVSEGLVGRNEAVAVVRNIYGFTNKQAKEMIGGFDEDGNLIEGNKEVKEEKV